MDSIVASIKAARHTSDIRTLNEELKRNEKSLIRNVDDVDAALRNLAFDVKSLGVLHLLAAQAKGCSVEALRATRFKDNALMLLRYGSTDQLLLNPKLLATVVRVALQRCEVGTPKTLQLLQPLMRLIAASAGKGPNTMTPLHSALVEAALSAKAYREVEGIIAQPCYGIADAAEWGIVVEDVLKYHYYGGMLFQGLKQWKNALEMYSACIATPASSVCDIVVEAYKRYAVISLLEHNKVLPLPPYTSSVVTRAMDPSVLPELGPYLTALKTAFLNGSYEELQAAIAKHADTFAADATTGLVNQLLPVLRAQQLKKLARTYVTMPFAMVARTLGVKQEEVEDVLLSLVESCKLSLSIDAEKEVVRFTSSRAAVTALEQSQLLAMAQRATELMSTLTAAAKKSALSSAKPMGGMAGIEGLLGDSGGI